MTSTDASPQAASSGRLTFHLLQGVLAFVFVAAGAANLLGMMNADLTRLGFPDYFNLIIGIAYLTAVVCIYQTKFTFLQDWAYAEMTISLIGAAGSHVLAGDPISNAVPAILLQILLIFAYVKRAKRLTTED
ncbi:MAG: DoxX family protein [Pseudomonadota bacterium]